MRYRNAALPSAAFFVNYFLDMDSDHSLRFPIGKAQAPQAFDPALVKQEMTDIAAFPARLAAAVQASDSARLKNTYRPGGWTALQVIHHVADSHINSYCRFKLALTEDNPVIKPYDEAAWALLADYEESLVETSLDLLRALHAKWSLLMARMTDAQWSRTFFHPESKRTIALYENVSIYGWHCRHHLRHVEIALSK
jgi:hypothetical protein